jgi:formylglycine-generating enzyme required for sulfatase activity
LFIGLAGGLIAQVIPEGQTNRSPLEGFVFIPGGTFMMGSPRPEPGHEYDELRHSVTLSPLYMGAYEVMGYNPNYRKGNNLPVETVIWYQAVEYCNRRSRWEGLTPAYILNGKNITWDRDSPGEWR